MTSGHDHRSAWADDEYPHLVRFLDRLDDAQLSYDVKVRPNSVRVSVLRARQRWELKFLPDGSVESQRFLTAGPVRHDLAALDEIFSDDG